MQCVAAQKLIQKKTYFRPVSIFARMLCLHPCLLRPYLEKASCCREGMFMEGVWVQTVARTMPTTMLVAPRCCNALVSGIRGCGDHPYHLPSRRARETGCNPCIQAARWNPLLEAPLQNNPILLGWWTCTGAMNRAPHQLLVRFSQEMDLCTVHNALMLLSFTEGN